MSRRRFSFSTGATDSLAETGRELWLAGVGALAEVDRGRRELFDDLVERGRKVERGQLKAVDRAVSRGAESAERLGAGLRRTVHASVEEVLHRANLPSRDDLKSLSARLDRLAERIESIAEQRS